MKEQLRHDVGRPLEFGTMYYDRELQLQVQEYLEAFDVITFSTWYGENILQLQQNLDLVLSKNPGKRLLAGRYLWDYDNCKPLTPELLSLQLQIECGYDMM